MQIPLNTSSNLPPLCFEQSKTDPVVTVADKDWWSAHRYQMGGLMRTISRSAVVASGLGFGADKSPWRAISGMIGMGAGAFLVASGEKNDPHNPTKNPEKISTDNIGRIYHGIVAASGAALLISGFLSKSNRWTEAIAGFWTMGWSAYAALAPENKGDALTFDKGRTKATPKGFADKQTEHSLLAEYKKNPKKLATDMLQFSALFAVADGIKGDRRPDIARIISGITLGASNYLQREMKDSDFLPDSSPLLTRG